jgi:hypothetical protein
MGIPFDQKVGPGWGQEADGPAAVMTGVPHAIAIAWGGE